jgi:hypothetical protein
MLSLSGTYERPLKDSEAHEAHRARSYFPMGSRQAVLMHGVKLVTVQTDVVPAVKVALSPTARRADISHSVE